MLHDRKSLLFFQYRPKLPFLPQHPSVQHIIEGLVFGRNVLPIATLRSCVAPSFRANVADAAILTTVL